MKKPTEKLNPELLEMSLEKIRDFIKILGEHEKKLENESNFKEASKVKEKINQLKYLEEEKSRLEVRRNHDNEKAQLELEKQEAMNNFDREYDSLHNDLKRKFDDMQLALNSQHSNEYEDGIKEFDENFPESNPKLSSEILDFIKKMNHLVKKREYEKAHEYQMKILELTDLHNKKWNNDTKNWKLDCKLQSIKSKQESEYQALKLKMESTLNEFLLKKKIEKDKLEKMYFNKMKDLVNEQTIQMNELYGSGKNAAIKSDKYLKSRGTTMNRKKKTENSSLNNDLPKLRSYNESAQIIDEN